MTYDKNSKYKSWGHGYLFFNSSYNYNSSDISSKPYINIANTSTTTYNIIAETLTDNSYVNIVYFDDSLNEITDSANILYINDNNYIISKSTLSYSSNFFDHIDFDQNMNILFFISTTNATTYYQNDTSSNYGYKEFAICIKDIDVSVLYNGTTIELKHAKKQKILNYLINKYYETLTDIDYTENNSSLPDDNFYAIFNLMNFFYNNNITKIYNCDFSNNEITIISNSTDFNNNKDLSYIDIDKSSNIYNILSNILLMEYTNINIDTTEIESKVENYVGECINGLLSDIAIDDIMNKLTNIENDIENLKKQVDNNIKNIKKNKDHIDFHHYWGCDM
jgi:hypothetical protein